MKKIICKICVYLICTAIAVPMLYAYDDWGGWDDYYDGGWYDEVVCYYDDGSSDDWYNDGSWYFDDYDDSDSWYDDNNDDGNDYYGDDDYTYTGSTDSNDTSESQQTNPNAVTNGECVRGVIEQLIRLFGGTPNYAQIMALLTPYRQFNQYGISGHRINYSDFKNILDAYLNTKYPDSQYIMNQEILNGTYVATKINDGSHAVIITGIDMSKREYIYYDPVDGNNGNRISWDSISHPVVITGKK